MAKDEESRKVEDLVDIIPESRIMLECAGLQREVFSHALDYFRAATMEPPPLFNERSPVGRPIRLVPEIWADVTMAIVTGIQGSPISIDEARINRVGEALRVPIFFDSGAQTNVLRKDVYEMLGPDKPELIPSAIVLVGEWDTHQGRHVFGDVFLHVSLNNGSVFAARFHVAETGRHPIIIGNPHRKALQPLLGSNFMFHHDPLAQNEHIRSEDGKETEVNSLNVNQIGPEEVVAYADTFVNVPGRTSAVVYVDPPKVPSEFVPAGPIIADSLIAFRSFSHLTDKTDNLQGQFPLLVANVSSRPLYLSPSIPLGYFRPLLPEEQVEEVIPFDMSVLEVTDPEEFLASTCLLPDDASLQNEEKELAAQIRAHTEHLTNAAECEALRALLWRFRKLFSSRLGVARVPPVRLPTTTDAPLRQAPRRLNPVLQLEVSKLIKEMLQQKVISPATSSDITSPIVMVKKKSGDWRFCVDYRKFNERLIPDHFPLPVIRDLHDTLRGSKIFSTLDFKSGFWQLSVHPEDRHKTTFVTPAGTYMFNVMPFGLKTAPSLFQRVMNTIFGDLRFDFAMAYIDDLIIFSGTFSEHLTHLHAVFDRMEKYNLHGGLSKCKFAKDHVAYLGHVVDTDGIRPSPSTVQRIRNLTPPSDLKGIRSFVHLVGYYREFIPHFADRSEPLVALTRKKTTWHWGELEQRAFEDLREALVSDPILAYPSFDRTFILTTDASDFGIGAILQQVDDAGRLHPVAFYSRTLSDVERRYPPSERECLAIVNAIKHFEYCLTNIHFIVQTDHRALKALVNTTSLMASRRLMHWQMYLQSVDCSIQYIAGKDNVPADFASRLATEGLINIRDALPPDHLSISTTEWRFRNALSHLDQGVDEVKLDVLAVELEDDVAEPEYSLLNSAFVEEVKQLQAADKELIPLLLFLQSGTVSTDPVVARDVQQRCRFLTLINGLLVHHVPNSGDRIRVVLPSGPLADKVIWHHHTHAFEGGHLGFAKVYEKLCRRFWFRGMYSRVKKLLARCLECQRTKTAHGPKPSAPLMPPVIPESLDHIAMDFVGPLPCSNHGNKWLLVVTDYATKWTEAYPLKESKAEEVAVCLADWHSHFGSPLAISSDRGKNFLAQVVQDFCKIWDGKQIFTASYHPQANGKVERVNATLCNMARAFAIETGTTWDEHIGAILFAYRSAMHSSTHASPANLLFGRELRSPLDAELDLYLKNYRTAPYDTDFLFKHAEALQRAREIARRHMEQTAIKLAGGYNAKRKLVRYQPGDVVWLENMQRQNKFTPRWIGPYRVSEEVHPGTYRIYDAKGHVHGSPITAEHLKRAVFDLDLSDGPASSSALTGGDSSSSPSQTASASSSSSSAVLDELLSSTIPLAPSSSASAPRRVLTPRPFRAGNLNSDENRVAPSLSDSFDVEDITDRKVQRGRVYYQVRWAGYDSSSWEPVENLEGCPDLIAEYDRAHSEPDQDALRAQRVAPSKLLSRFQEVVDSSTPSSSSASSSSSAAPTSLISSSPSSSLDLSSSFSSSSSSFSDFSPSLSSPSSATAGLRRSTRLQARQRR